MRTLVSTKDLDRDQWLDWRRMGIGGSDAATILGINPWQSKFDCWLSKVDPVEDNGNEAMEWGVRVEPILAQKFTDDTGKKLHNRYAILQHDEHDFMLATVDRLVVGEDAGWEGKTTNFFYKDDGDPKEIYEVQCQHYMAVTGRAKWYISVLAGGQKYYMYEVERDNHFINNVLIPAEREFWKLVETNTIPEYDGSDGCSNYIASLYPEATQDLINLPDQSKDLLELYDWATTQEKEAKAEKDRIANELKSMMGEYSKGILGDRKIYWSNVNTTKFDSKAFQAENKELYERYLKESSYRRFQIK